MKYAFMARHRSVWPIRWMSQALGVSMSGFYEWLTRPESNRSMSNRAILVRIRESFEASHQTYGSPRVWRDLRDWNVPCSENRTARLMRQAGSGCPSTTQDSSLRRRSTLDDLHPMCWIGSFKPTHRIRSGWLTSPTSQLERGGCIWRSCSISTLGWSWAGPCRGT